MAKVEFPYLLEHTPYGHIMCLTHAFVLERIEWFNNQKKHYSMDWDNDDQRTLEMFEDLLEQCEKEGYEEMELPEL